MAWKARIEWVLADGTVDGLAVVIAAQTLTGTGATVVPATAAPAFKSLTRGIARVTMLSGAALVAIDDTSPIETDSVRMATGAATVYEFSLATGQILYFVEAADGVSAGSTVSIDPAQVTALTPPSNTDYAKDGTKITAAVMPTGGVGILGWLSAIYNKLIGTLSVDLPTSLWYNDTVTNLAANATFTGTSRSSGGTSGVVGPYSYFNASFYSSHASAALGATIQSSNDGTTWITEASVALTAATPATLSVPVTNANYRVVLTNGATLTTSLRINSGFTRS